MVGRGSEARARTAAPSLHFFLTLKTGCLEVSKMNVEQNSLERAADCMVAPRHQHRQNDGAENDGAENDGAENDGAENEEHA